MSLRLNRLAAVALPLALALGLLSARTPAADKPPAGTISVATTTDDDAIRNRPVMISVLGDTTIVQQEETQLTRGVQFSRLPTGSYDVRIEGDGLVTLVKRGIQVRPDYTTHIVGGPMRAGQGVKVIEYATGGLSREELNLRLKELADRLDRIESTLARLQPTAAPPPPNRP